MDVSTAQFLICYLPGMYIFSHQSSLPTILPWWLSVTGVRHSSVSSERAGLKWSQKVMSMGQGLGQWDTRQDMGTATASTVTDLQRMPASAKETFWAKKRGTSYEASSNSSFEGLQLLYFPSGPEPRQPNPRTGDGGEDALRTLTGMFSLPGCLQNEKVPALPVGNNVNLGINKAPGNITG